MAEYRVLDLFSGLGGFSSAFAESERWAVTAVDIDPDIVADVMDLRPSDFEQEFDVIVAGHPCTYFSPARNMAQNGDQAWHGDIPATDGSRDHVAMLYHTVGLIRGLSPTYWFLENPVGRAKQYLGPPTAIVTQCQYGRETQKPTMLWGDHPPMTYRRCSPGDDCHVTAETYTPGKEQDRQGTLAKSNSSAERAVLPYDLSDAIREACERGLDGEAPEQATVADF